MSKLAVTLRRPLQESRRESRAKWNFYDFNLTQPFLERGKLAQKNPFSIWWLTFFQIN